MNTFKELRLPLLAALALGLGHFGGTVCANAGGNRREHPARRQQQFLWDVALLRFQRQSLRLGRT